MRKFRMRRQDPLDLEAQLRASRPEPRPDFVKELSAEIRETREPARRVRFLRLSPVMGLTVLVLIGAGAFGGIAIATNGGGGGDKKQSQSNNDGNGNKGNDRNETKGNDSENEGPDDDQYEDKVVICHKPGTPAEQTLLVPHSALDGHLDHGDLEGPCPPG